MTGYIVWIHGPYPAATSDITIFRKTLKHLLALSPGEKVEADGGYRGEPHYIYTPKDVICERQKSMKQLVRSRHETLNGRLAMFKILTDVFRFDLCEHYHVVHAVTTIVQMMVECGSIPFQVKGYKSLFYYPE